MRTIIHRVAAGGALGYVMIWTIIALSLALVLMTRTWSAAFAGFLLIIAVYSDVLRAATALTFVDHVTDFAYMLVAYALLAPTVIVASRLRRSIRDASV